jgi:hypothetical protein
LEEGRPGLSSQRLRIFRGAKSMIETASLLDLRNAYEDLRARVEQLGRFL